MSLSDCDVSIDAPEPMFIVGAPVKSDFTYALMILIKSFRLLLVTATSLQLIFHSIWMAR